MNAQKIRKKILRKLQEYKGKEPAIRIDIIQKCFNPPLQDDVLNSEILYLEGAGYLKVWDKHMGTDIINYSLLSIESEGMDFLAELSSKKWSFWKWIGARLDQILTAAVVALVTTLITNWLTKN